MTEHKQTVSELVDRWLRAEQSAALDTLDRLATEDFQCVGPRGFVLDKQQWLARLGSGDLQMQDLALTETHSREYDSVTVTIGRWSQRATYRGVPVDAELRATLVTVDGADGARMAGLHLSPIDPPPAVDD